MAVPLLALAAPALLEAAPAILDAGANLLGNLLGKGSGNDKTQLPPETLDLITGNAFASPTSLANLPGGAQSSVN